MKKVLILSGAGLSAESGISTFRDSDGLWENYDVMEVCSTQGWAHDRDKVTQFYNARRADIATKKPNKAHEFLARLEKKYPNQIYNMTQNVDNMLEKAGCEDVTHLHGTLTDLRCESCGHVWDVGYAAQNEHDACPRCESDAVRHNVVMFGEQAPKYMDLQDAINDATLFVAIGTSGQVIDIVGISHAFKHSILVNPNREKMGSSYIDNYFEYFLEDKASVAVEELGALIDEHLGDGNV